MDFNAPDVVLEGLTNAGVAKSKLSTKDLAIRGALSGAILGFATTLALTATVQTNLGIVGALVFPVGFVMIVLLGLELVTGNFAVLPLPLLEGRISTGSVARNWAIVFAANLAGALIYAALFYATVHLKTPIADRLIATAEAKTIAYEHAGTAGMVEVFAKAILCNWMVTMGVVMAFTSSSVIGKIAAMWLPILTFFGQGFEHSVVNMFVIPIGMALGAHVSFSEWWMWNQIPVTLGNLVGGLVFTGLALYATHRKRAAVAATAPAAAAPAQAASMTTGATVAS